MARKKRNGDVQGLLFGDMDQPKKPDAPLEQPAPKQAALVEPARIGKTPVCVGTSGYSFADWIGPFYPKDLPKPHHLSYYADKFPAVEINSSYYAMPAAKMLENMMRRTPDGFLFSVKCYKGITHEYEGEGVFAKFGEALRPLKEAGRLGAVLAQFPQRFKNLPPAREHLALMAEQLSGLPVVIEFRDRSWAKRSALQGLRDLGLGFCCVDEPDLPGLFPRTAAATSPVGYLRLHSRNAANWYAGGAARYDYNYSDAEMVEWIDKLKSLAATAATIFVFFNNCHAAQAAANAQRMQEILRGL